MEEITYLQNEIFQTVGSREISIIIDFITIYNNVYFEFKFHS